MQLRDIKGIGEARLSSLAKAGIYGVADLLNIFPSNYIDTGQRVDLSTVIDGELVGIAGVVESLPTVRHLRRGLSVTSTKIISDCGQTVSVSWFNRPYIGKQIEVGQRYMFVGKAKIYRSTVTISSPSIENLTDTRIVPIYSPPKGLSKKLLLEAINQLLDTTVLTTFLPPQLIHEYGIIDVSCAMNEIHRPTDMTKLEQAKLSLALVQLAHTIACYNIIKKKQDGARRRVYTADPSAVLAQFVDKLPYALTGDQQAAIRDIVQSLVSDTMCNRLLMGDVGSGKTVVAAAAMYYVVASGYQAVLMAPTEILARQHYATFINIFEPLGIKVECITSSTSAKQLKAVKYGIESGSASIIVGTHALLSESVIIPKLSFVVIDEQHRFGVGQRASLENKSVGCDTLSLSATPIPRTLALIMYGDLSISKLSAAHAGKAKVTTRIVPSHKLSDMYKYIIDKALYDGEQAYIVCPRIDEDDDDSEGLRSAVGVFDEVQRAAAYAKNKIKTGLIHSKLYSEDKSDTMLRWANGEIDILVGTTVVEVGIDVHNATTMIIFDADRYGLATLHQLRGRVGRGKKDGYCFVLHDSRNSETIERLNYFAACSDGFELAEYDFVRRGAGDFLGTKQHGEGGWRMLPLTPELVDKAREIAGKLSRYPDVISDMTAALQNGGGSFVRRLTLN